MGKYDTIDREFFREPEHAAEIITNTVYRGRLRVMPQDLSRIPEKCKESKDKRTELERDALFLCKNHTVKNHIGVRPYKILGYSFCTNDWGRSWIVWPVAGIGYAVTRNIALAIKKSK